jgi:hypothetical protein
MPQVECPTCEALQEKAGQALINHLRLGGKLQIAELSFDSKQIAGLEPFVEAARIEREKALAEYVAHRKTHEQTNSAEAGM